MSWKTLILSRQLSRASQEGSLSFSQDVPEVIAIAEPLQGLWENS